MKLEYYNINEFTIYLNNDYIDKIGFDLSVRAEENFKHVLDKLKTIYNLELYGYYKVNVYINKNYGIIMELYKEDDEYVKIFGESLDLKILFKPDSKLLYELDMYCNYDIGDITKYYYNNKFYIEINSITNKLEYYKLLESSKIVYGNALKKIENNMIKI